MPRLILIRHAKAAHSAGSDLDRPLAAVGVEQCKVVAGLLREWLTSGFAVTVSPARRTRETWAEIGQRLDAAPGADFDERVYDAMPGTLLELVQSSDQETLVLVGHSPGIPRLGHLLCAEPAPRVDEFLRSYPTSGCLILEAPEPFRSWQPGCAEVVAAFSGDIQPGR